MGKKKKKDKKVIKSLIFEKENYLIFFGGVVTIILGYIIMAAGETYSTLSLTIAPIILFVGYMIIVPLAIMYRKKPEKVDTRQQDQR